MLCYSIITVISFMLHYVVTYVLSKFPWHNSVICITILSHYNAISITISIMLHYNVISIIIYITALWCLL